MRVLTFIFLLAALGATRPGLEDRWISVSGITLHIRCGGERRSKAPMVLLEAGAGTSTDTWSYVHTPIAEFARVCAYDRPGIGTSERAPDGLTTAEYIDLIQRFLKAASEPPPYVMVGHSMGGLIVSLYAVKHPADISGLVLVDSSHEDQRRKFAALTGPPISAATDAPPAAPVPLAPPAACAAASAGARPMTATKNAKMTFFMGPPSGNRTPGTGSKNGAPDEGLRQMKFLRSASGCRT